MIKTVLVPTDFCVASLNVVKHLLSNSPKNCKYHIILLHGYQLSDSIHQLLFFSKSKTLQELSDRQFDEACTIIKNKFDSQILSFQKDIFTGFTKAAFKNYIEANKIDVACIASDYQVNFKNKSSFDIVPYIRKSNLEITEISCGAEIQAPEQGSLAELFLNPTGISVTESGIQVSSVVN